MRRWLLRAFKLMAIVILVTGVALAAWQGRRLVDGGEDAPLHAVRRVEARVEAGAEAASVLLRLEVDGPGFGRQSRLPVLPAGVSLVAATMDGAPVETDLAGGCYVLLLGGGGRHQAELRYSMRLSGERRLDLHLPEAVSSTVELVLPEAGMMIQSPPPAIVEMLQAKSGSAARVLTPPTRRLDLSWFPRPSQVVTASRVAASTETLYTIQGDQLAGRTVYGLRVEGRDISELRLTIPKGVTVDQVEATWLKGYEPAGGVLRVQAAAPLLGQNSLTVMHRRALGDGEVDLAVPGLEGAVRQWGFGAVASTGPVEIRTLSVDGGQVIDPRGLPASLRSGGAASVARAFRYENAGSVQKLSLVRHREVETLDAACDSLHALLTYTDDGRCMGKAVYSIRNALRQHLTVRLPEGATIWSAFVAGRPVRPGGSDDGGILVPLNCGSDSASRAFAVELVYYIQGRQFADKGAFSAALPAVDLPVANVMLSVSVPEHVTLEDFAGSLKPVRAFAFSLDPQDDALVRGARAEKPADTSMQDVNLQLDQQLAQGQTGNRRLRLDFQALNANPNMQKAMRFNNDNANFMRQYFLENGQPAAPVAGSEAATLNLTGFGQDELAAITGLASLSVAVPAGGRIYRFEQQLLIGSPEPVRADYWSSLAGTSQADAPTRLASDISGVCWIGPGGVQLDARLGYRLSSGKADELAYTLPAGAKVQGLAGSNVAEWQAEGTALRVKLVRPERSGGVLRLDATLPAPGDGRCELALPRLAGAERERLILGVGAPEDYAIEFPDAAALERLSPAALPGELLHGGVRQNVFALAPGSGGKLICQAVRHAEVAALQATCDSVNAISFTTDEGVAVTRVIWEIRNAGRRHLKVSMPEGARLWGAFVNDRAVKPLAGGRADEVLLPLETAQEGRVRSYPVEVIYVLPGAPFAPRGEFASSLPRIDMPVMHAMYSLYLPSRMRLARMTGSLKPVRSFSAAAVPPPAEEKGRVAAAEMAEVVAQNECYQRRQEALERNVSQQKLVQAIGAARGKSDGSPGAPAPAAVSGAEQLEACGLKVYIPAVGQLLRFERHLVVDGELDVKLAYRS
jgi:hypothetical protein